MKLNLHKKVGGFLFIFLMGACAVCSGDVVYLITGEELIGTVIEETSESVRLKLDSGGLVRLEKKLVKGIRYTAAPGAKDGEEIRGGQPGQIVKIANARNICKHLQGKLKDKNSLRKLQGAFEEMQDEEIKICLGCTLVMGYFYAGADGTARKLRKSLSQRFPGYPDLKLIQVKNLSVTCEKCSGSGKLTVKCVRCGGSGVCRMCNGKGKIESSFTKEIRKCPDCNGSGVCRKCKGTGECVEICRKCYGKGSVISKDRIKRVYRQLLARSVDRLFTAEQTASGLVRFQGMWVTPEEKSVIGAERFAAEQAAKGLVKFKGRWITREQKASIEAQRIAAEQTAKGLVKFEGKWMTPEKKSILSAQRKTEKEFFAEAIRKAGSEPNLDVAVNTIKAAIAVYSNSPCAIPARKYFWKLRREDVKAQREREKKFFAEAIRKVGSEPNIDAAISMLEAAINVYRNSSRAGPAREYLQKLRADKVKAQRALEKKFFTEAVRKARSEPDIDAAISMLEAAINVYRNSFYADQACEYLQKLYADKDKAVKAAREEKRKRGAIASKGQIPKVIDGFLNAQRWGKIGTEYWEDPGLARKLPGVIDWKIIDQRVFGTIALVRVDIDSKIEDGSSVQKVWTFHMRYTDSWKVHLISE